MITGDSSHLPTPNYSGFCGYHHYNHHYNHHKCIFPTSPHPTPQLTRPTSCQVPLTYLTPISILSIINLMIIMVLLIKMMINIVNKMIRSDHLTDEWSSSVALASIFPLLTSGADKTLS